jgi:hypothetical protein
MSAHFEHLIRCRQPEFLREAELARLCRGTRTARVRSRRGCDHASGRFPGEMTGASDRRGPRR